MDPTSEARAGLALITEQAFMWHAFVKDRVHQNTLITQLRGKKILKLMDKPPDSSQKFDASFVFYFCCFSQWGMCTSGELVYLRGIQLRTRWKDARNITRRWTPLYRWPSDGRSVGYPTNQSQFRFTACEKGMLHSVFHRTVSSSPGTAMVTATRVDCICIRQAVAYPNNTRKSSRCFSAAFCTGSQLLFLWFFYISSSLLGKNELEQAATYAA